MIALVPDIPLRFMTASLGLFRPNHSMLHKLSVWYLRTFQKIKYHTRIRCVLQLKLWCYLLTGSIRFLITLDNRRDVAKILYSDPWMQYSIVKTCGHRSLTNWCDTLMTLLTYYTAGEPWCRSLKTGGSMSAEKCPVLSSTGSVAQYVHIGFGPMCTKQSRRCVAVADKRNRKLYVNEL